MKKAPPPDPLRENFNNLGQNVDDYNNVEILFLLFVRTTEARRLRQVRPQDETAGTTASQPAAGFYVVV